MYISCKKCMKCRLQHVYETSIRLVHQASLQPDNVFLTLTYDDKHLPANASLDKRDVQLFLKRLRKYAVSRRGRSFKYYICGEYGTVNGRPHYHAVVFDLMFKDKKFDREQSGYPIFLSEDLSRLWGMGRCEFGSVTQDSATYCSKYVTKIIGGDDAEAHYAGRLVEFSTSSNGLGLKWLEQFHEDVYSYDAVVLKGGAKMRPPRYYDSKYELMFPNEAAAVKAKRLRMLEKRENIGFLRFAAIEEAVIGRLNQKRGSL